MKRKMNRIISMLLSVMLVFTALPEAVFGYDGEQESEEYLTEAADGEAVAEADLPEADGASESEDNNSPNKANPISVNTEYSGNIQDDGDYDYYHFRLNAAGELSFSFSHDYVDSDRSYWRIRLYSAADLDDVLIERFFRGNEMKSVTTSSVGLPAGDYYILIDDMSWAADTYRFKVNYTASDAWEKERNNTFNTPNEILTNREYSGSIAEDDDNDYYRFVLEEDGVISIAFKHEYVDSDRDFWRLRLFRAEYSDDVMMERYFKGNELKTLNTSEIGLPAGRYILQLDDLSWSEKTYSFSVNYTKADTWEKERNDSFVTPNDILLNTEYSGCLMENEDKDHYRFHLEKAGMISIDFSHEYVDSSSSFWRLQLFPADSVDERIYVQNYAGNEKKVKTTEKLKLAAGDYIIFLDDLSWSGVTYRFKVNDASSGSKPKKESNPTDVIPGGGGATDPQPLLSMDKEQSIVLVKGQKFMMADSGWKTAAKKVVSISKKTVKAKAEGETDLTLGEYSIHAKVVSVEQTKNEKNMKLEAGTSGMISLGGIKAGDGTIVIGGEELPVCFMTSAPDVALVDDSGSVTAVAAGTATITAYINGVAFKCKIKVSESTPKLHRTLHVNLGKSKSIKIKGLNKAEWVPAEEDIVKIQKNKVTGKNIGNTTLSFGEYTVDVFVEDPSIAGSSKPYAQTLNMKAKTEETITLKKVDQPVFFKSSKPHIAWVDEDGVIHARSKGTAKLMAKINGKSIKITVKVD